MNKDPIAIYESFIPKNGFKLKSLISLSYSIDLSLASSLLVYCLPYANEKYLFTDPSKLKKEELRVALLEIVPKVLFIVNGDTNFKKESKFSSVEKILVDRVVKVAPRVTVTGKRGSFHPKLILAHYENDKGEVYSRSYIGSRNLTLDTALEFGVVNELHKKGKNKKFGNDLCEFLTHLSEKEVAKRNLKTFVKGICSHIKEHEISLHDQNISFHWQSRRLKKSLWSNVLSDKVKNANQIAIVSPWLSSSALKCLKESSKEGARYSFWCLEEYYRMLKNSKITNDVYVSTGPAENIYNIDVEGEFSSKPFHIKLYLFEKKDGIGDLVFGSANFTESGLGLNSLVLNTELLISYENIKFKDYYDRLFVQSESLVDVVDEEFDSDDNTSQKTIEWLNSLEVQWNDQKFPDELQIIQENYFSGMEVISFKVDLYFINEINGTDKKCIYDVKKIRKKDCAVKTNLSEEEANNLSSLISCYLEVKIKNKYIVYRSDKVAYLPEKFLNNRARSLEVKDLSLSFNDCVDSLAELIEEPVTGPETKSGTNTGNEESNIYKALGGLTLDRFAYRLALYKKENGGDELFKYKLERAEQIMELIKGDEEVIADFKKHLNFVLKGLQ